MADGESPPTVGGVLRCSVLLEERTETEKLSGTEESIKALFYFFFPPQFRAAAPGSSVDEEAGGSGFWGLRSWSPVDAAPAPQNGAERPRTPVYCTSRCTNSLPIGAGLRVAQGMEA